MTFNLTASASSLRPTPRCVRCGLVNTVRVIAGTPLCGQCAIIAWAQAQKDV
jgi:hypothetical protein